jgi:hypothetical protein
MPLSVDSQASGTAVPLHHPPGAVSDERVPYSAAEQLELTLKTPWRNGATHLVM